MDWAESLNLSRLPMHNLLNWLLRAEVSLKESAYKVSFYYIYIYIHLKDLQNQDIKNG